ncbi:DUF885 domain-containing protein [Alteriqipengyuania sp. NZ-12B]|uniref:DUF885 domain-containing protein n=1 Tax=Alteriqipengyuania abyssalis TaxID=2860200 RepID=A0ABS7PC05_9SPHN|nr:DUF885 domain-containing protein [Alteriqipengyuania abyssalis]MBY8336584.1 DUF885 domain-containing protein [Alteriqipengyuania abyssalis]
MTITRIPGQTAIVLLASLGLAACTTTQTETGTAPVANVEAPAAQVPADIDTLFDRYDAAQLEMSPLTKAYRGIRDEDYGTWGDFSDQAEVREQALLQDTAAAMREGYDVAALSPQDALSYRLFDAMAKRSASLFPYRDYGYIFDQMSGAQSQLPAFLINIHAVQNADQAADYVSRIDGLGDVIDTLTAQSRERADAGVMPPDWVYPYVISDVRNLLDAGENSAVLEDFRGKVEALDLSAADTAALEAAAIKAWNASAVPAYQRLLAEMKRQQAIAPTDDGIWRFPEGEAYYAALLKNYTTTDLTADQIHRIGLENVARIHDEMRAIMDQVGFEGSLQEFFEFTRTDDRFYYDTREAYLADAQARLDAMEAKLPEFFATLPKAPLQVKPVEAFREKSAGKAFYQSPAPDGSRPGTYYVNLYNLKDMSKNELEALAYHEGLPGHHLQRTIQTELGDVPPFRRFGGVTAYTEGWGLYSEELGKDMGFYTDPYADFGRLQMELWRACRLVVDTGIHSKRWSREQAIQYLKDNTPNPDGDIRKAIERYVVYPGQATAYMIGKLKIMELREQARAELGEDFDIREFHDAVLLPGPVPLDILEENVEAWVAARSAGAAVASVQ